MNLAFLPFKKVDISILYKYRRKSWIYVDEIISTQLHWFYSIFYLKQISKNCLILSVKIQALDKKKELYFQNKVKQCITLFPLKCFYFSLVSILIWLYFWIISFSLIWTFINFNRNNFIKKKNFPAFLFPRFCSIHISIAYGLKKRNFSNCTYSVLNFGRNIFELWKVRWELVSKG